MKRRLGGADSRLLQRGTSVGFICRLTSSFQNRMLTCTRVTTVLERQREKIKRGKVAKHRFKTLFCRRHSREDKLTAEPVSLHVFHTSLMSTRKAGNTLTVVSWSTSCALQKLTNNTATTRAELRR